MAVLLAKEMNKDCPVIIISPLKSLIADQIRECGRFGLSSCKLEAENVESLKKECNFDIIFAVRGQIFPSTFKQKNSWHPRG